MNTSPAAAWPFTPQQECALQKSLPVSECNALVALDERMHFTKSSQMERYHFTFLKPCAFERVIRCTNGHVTEIDVRWMNLTGTISPAIAFLPELRTLDLGWNNLRGSIPSEIRYLKKLQRFSVRSNQLSGEVPTTLASISSLRPFDEVGYHSVDIGQNPNLTLKTWGPMGLWFLVR